MNIKILCEPPSIPRKRQVLSYTHAVYFIKVIGKPFVSHAFIEILSSLVETFHISSRDIYQFIMGVWIALALHQYYVFYFS